MPATKPPICAHQATPPDRAVCDDNALPKNCMMNQKARKKTAGISIISKKKKQDIKLNDLLSGITDKNLHKEVVYTKPSEKEIKQ